MRVIATRQAIARCTTNSTVGDAAVFLQPNRRLKVLDSQHVELQSTAVEQVECLTILCNL